MGQESLAGSRAPELLIAETITALQRNFCLSPAAELPTVVDAVETALADAAQGLITAVLKSKFGSASVSLDNKTVLLHGELFHVLWAPNVTVLGEVNRRALLLTILPTSDARHKDDVARQRVAIRGPGRYCSIDLLFCRQLQSCIDAVAGRLEELYQGGYDWLLNHIRIAFSMLATHTINGVYNAVRRGFTENPKVADSIMLAVVEDDKAYYIMDPGAADRIINEISSAPASIYGPAELLAEIGTTVVPFENLIGRNAFERDEVTPINIRGGWYIENRPAFEIGEEAAYGTQRITVFPIVSRGKRLLGATFPTELRAIAVPVLKSRRDEMVQIFNEGIGTFGEAWARMTANAKSSIVRNLPNMPEWLLRILTKLFF